MPETKKIEETKLVIREERDIPPVDVELRVDDSDNPKMTGYATKYGNFYDLGWFRERVAKGAFDDVLDDDVRCLKNHDPNLILGRTTNQTLRLESNSTGLKFEDDLPDTTTGKDTREEIRRGDISGCSFSFIVAEDDWKYFDDDRQDERTITKIGQLFDVGPVVYPANPKTSVSARDYSVAKRSLDKFKEENQEVVEEEPPAKTEEELEAERARKRDIDIGYNEAGRIINRLSSKLSDD
jgi:hypothetical protein